MKKRILLLPVITLLLGGLAFFAKPKAESVSAADAGAYHLFVQIEKESDLREGDTVFFGTPGGTVFSALSGNPVFASEAHPSGRSEDGKKYYTYYTESYQDMLLMRVEPGAYSGTWSFKSLRSSKQEENYAHPTRGRYLAYGHNYSDKKYTNINAYGDVNMADGKGEFTSWTVEFTEDEDHYAIIKRYGEEYDTHIQWVYYGRTARNNFGYYTNNTDIYLYREVSADQGSGRVSLDIFSHPDQTVVYENDYLDLTGLEMTVTIDKGEDSEFSFTSNFENEPGFYTVNFAAHGATRVYCSYAGWNFNLEVTVIEDTSDYTYFNELKTQRSDYRGTYIIVYQDGMSISQLKEDGWVLEYDKDSADGSIHSKMHNKIMTNRAFITRHRIDGTSYMFLQIGNDEKYVIRDGNEIDITSDASSLTAASAVTIDENCNIHMGDAILYYASSSFHLNGNPDASVRAKLYKRVVDFTKSDESTARYDAFLASFASVTSAGCDASGDDDTTITTTQWNSLKTAFDNISDEICGYDFQGYLANTTYVHNEERGTGSVKDLIDRYDFILSRYQSSLGFDDFMDRKAGSAYQNNYGVPASELVSVTNQTISDNTSIMIVVVVTTISITSLTILVILKKRRQ